MISLMPFKIVPVKLTIKATNTNVKRDSLIVLTNPWSWIHLGKTPNEKIMSDVPKEITMYLPVKPNKKNKLSVET